MTDPASLALAAALMAGGDPPAPPGEFSTRQFAQLEFLVGQWQGTGPDGKLFYEMYDFDTPQRLRSRRFADARFVDATDGSSVSLESGKVFSRWGEYEWRATQIDADRACFEPVKAPSSFCWVAVGETIEVTQNWTDADGAAQSYRVTLQRAERNVPQPEENPR